MTKPWTPGPHKVRSAPECNKDDGDTWAYEMEVSDKHRTFAEHEANAKLWANSTEMAELLSKIVYEIKNYHKDFDAHLFVAAERLLARVGRQRA